MPLIVVLNNVFAAHEGILKCVDLKQLRINRNKRILGFYRINGYLNNGNIIC
jgi:hypothetical protein